MQSVSIGIGGGEGRGGEGRGQTCSSCGTRMARKRKSASVIVTSSTPSSSSVRSRRIPCSWNAYTVSRVPSVSCVSMKASYVSRVSHVCLPSVPRVRYVCATCQYVTLIISSIYDAQMHRLLLSMAPSYPILYLSIYLCTWILRQRQMPYCLPCVHSPLR